MILICSSSSFVHLNALHGHVHLNEQTPDIVILLLCDSPLVFGDLRRLSFAVVDRLLENLTLLQLLKRLLISLLFHRPNKVCVVRHHPFFTVGLQFCLLVDSP